MLIDQAKIFVKAGNGGNGCCSFRREKYVPRGGPNGGNGGKGGDVILVASGRVKTLLDFHYRPLLKAPKGEHGRGKNCTGATGDNLVVNVPVGTVVKKDNVILGDLLREGQSVLVARGGRGGRGNAALKSRDLRVPRIAENGDEGEETNLFLELKLIADVGLIGCPNSGKSTLLSRLSNAHPKIASYPFTTTEPILGISKLKDGSSCTIADIPGLINGAHQGKGLGDKFLRHIERTSLLVHVIDITGYDNHSPADNFYIINSELEAYSPSLAKKRQIVVANKIDLDIDGKKMRELRRKIHKRVMPISALAGDGIESLKIAILKKVASRE